MKFIADLHIHSKFSRATAKNLDLENLYIAAQLKGITVVGTGDFTYPGWISEIKEKLVPAEPGLFKLKDQLADLCDQQVPQSCRGLVRFILATEISNIYKKNGKTRKNHNLVFVPDLEVAEHFTTKLDKIGNIKSDGRPILGLDARDLLEIVLETSDQAYLIPAHIWTPWFSILGSKSGFDSIEECFEDLTPYIFAVETGLSSDPPMNWRVSGLDGLTLVSNSDSHSPSNLGREANLFNTELSYASIRSAIKSGDSEQFLGTFEFYPEEGKYHLDGHRNCKVRLRPQKTKALDGKCPQCGKGLTLGVLYRVEELADREDGQKPQKHHAYRSIIPLVDIFAEIFRVGPKSKKVNQAYLTALNKLGSEFDILHYLDPDALDTSGIPLLGEAVKRMRHKQIDVNPGYDGEYGQVKIFSEHERSHFMGQQSLFYIPPIESPRRKSSTPKTKQSKKRFRAEQQFSLNVDRENYIKKDNSIDILHQLNDKQRQAVQYSTGPLMIVAGPGTGKTRTLTHRIAYLIRQKGIAPQSILALTFTNKAAEEMRQRLQSLFIGAHQLPLVATFHALCLKILNDLDEIKPVIIVDDTHRKNLLSEAIAYVEHKGIEVSLKSKILLDRIIQAKQQILGPQDILKEAAGENKAKLVSEVYQTYQALLSIQGLYDYEDLIFKVVRLFESDDQVRRTYQDRYRHIFVDEYQDLNQGQYRIIRALAAPENGENDICVIGDPDQSIYGFRGSDIAYFKRFMQDYPNAGFIYLTQNYRSTATILDASYQVIKDHRIQPSDSRTYSQIDGVKTISIYELAHERAEAKAVARIIENLVGGSGFHSIDTGAIDDANLSKARSYSDFAVLYRTNEQHRIMAEVFEMTGIPFQIASREHAINKFGLGDLLSFLRVVEGCADYGDYETMICHSIPGIGKKIPKLFKNWCYQNRFSLYDGLSKAKRFPVPGLNASHQQSLNDFTDHLMVLKKKIAGMAVAEKLIYLSDNSIISTTFDKDTNSRAALDNLMEFSKSFGNRVVDFFAAVALHTDTDAYAFRVEKVALMTMHAAKGLEFPIVFITGCEQDYIPFKRAGDAPQDIQEERRLFYVAMTRAMERLYFTRAKRRRIYGKMEFRNLSPFVADIETRLKKKEIPHTKRSKKKTDQKQLTLF